MPNFVSPNDIKKAAEDMMLDGREAQTEEDKATVLNFVAFNVEPSLAEKITKLFVRIFGWTEFTDKDIEDIVDFQLSQKASQN